MAQTNTTTDPPVPEGYEAPREFRYPKVLVNSLAFLLLVVIAPLLAILILKMRNAEPPSFDLQVWEIALILATNIITIICHELLHGIVWKICGYSVEFGFKFHLLAAYAAAFRQFQKRNHIILVALTPLLLISLLVFPFLLIPDRLVTIVAFTAIVFNIAGAAGDIYLSVYLLRLPAKTLMYDVSSHRMLLFIPL